MEDYIILEFGKIVIKIEDNKNKYYKSIDNQLYDLSKEELEKVEALFNKKDKYIYYSEKLDSLVLNNKLLIESKDYLMNFLNFIEGIIPEGCHNNFYRNIQTLQLNLNFDSINNGFIGVEASETNNSPRYNVKENKITIEPSWLKKAWEISQKSVNPTEFFWSQVAEAFLHELIHMASSSYDVENNIACCGFDVNPSSEEKHTNSGITEGMTEVITFSGIPSQTELASIYYVECLIINQLIQIVGRDTMLVSYFKNQETKNIREQLNSIINNPFESQILMHQIENNFIIGELKVKQSLLGNIQSKLVNYFIKKVEKDLENNIDKEIIKNQMFIFEMMLVTKEKLSANGKEPDNYMGIDESIKQFMDFKNSINLENNSIKS